MTCCIRFVLFLPTPLHHDRHHRWNAHFRPMYFIAKGKCQRIKSQECNRNGVHDLPCRNPNALYPLRI